MTSLQIFDPVVCHLDLLLQHRDAPGEIVVLPDFPGQLLQLSVGDGLMRIQLGLHIPGGLVAGDDYPQQRQAAGNQGHNDSFRHVHSFPAASRAANINPKHDDAGIINNSHKGFIAYLLISMCR